MKTKGVKNRPDVREKILWTATRLFGDRGFDAVTLRDIASACDIPLSTLSSHFALKQSLQNAVFLRAIEVTFEREVIPTLASGSPKQRLRKYVTSIVDLMLSDLPEMKVLDRQLQDLDRPETLNAVVATFGNRPTMDSIDFIAGLASDTNSDILKVIPAIRLVQLVFAAIYGIVKLRPIHGQVVGAKAISNAVIKRDIVLMFERMLHIEV
jgi:AcrR family transcriptional regulator